MEDHQWKWDEYASQVLKDLMHTRRVTYLELARGLGVERRALTNKVNRGQFSFSFFLRCLAALDCRLSEVPWGILEAQNPPPQLPRSNPGTAAVPSADAADS